MIGCRGKDVTKRDFNMSKKIMLMLAVSLMAFVLVISASIATYALLRGIR